MSPLPNQFLLYRILELTKNSKSLKTSCDILEGRITKEIKLPWEVSMRSEPLEKEFLKSEKTGMYFNSMEKRL